MSQLTPGRVKVNSFQAPLCIRVRGVHREAQGCAMVGKCANKFCLNPHHPNQGKVFRLDIDLGNKAGGNERKTAYIWLCPCCAQTMHPKVELRGDTVTLLLAANDPMWPTDTGAAAERVI